MTLTCSESEKVITVKNDHYIAKIDKKNGELVSVFVALTKDHLRIKLTEKKETNVTTNNNAHRVEIEENYDFYVKISSLSKILGLTTELFLKRTYEFTRNKTIYEQAAFHNTTVRNKRPVRKTDVSIEKLEWVVETESSNVHASRTADDLFIKHPDGPLGGLNSSLEGFIVKTNFSKSNPFSRSIISRGLFLQTNKLAILPIGKIFLVCTAIQIGSDGDEPITSEDFEKEQYQFYPDFGTRAKAWAKKQKTKFSFANWNNYRLNRFAPITEPKIEDFLVRASIHLCNRMKFDDGWLKSPKWSNNYPKGDIFTAHSRVFPSILYLWAYLALEWKEKEFKHHPCDADVLFNQLQETYKFYLPSNPRNFHNTYGPQKIPYLSYSAVTKKRKAIGVLNTHAHALHFAWLMIGANKFFGDEKRAKEWDTLVKKYHAGSKALFKKLYPHAKGKKKVSGFLRYSIDGYKFTMPGIHSYNSISYEGIAAGYIDSKEYEAEFVDAVERASQPHLDYNPWNKKVNSCGDAPFKGRLCRILPLALTFIGDKLVMSREIQAASIDEVLKYNEGQEFTHSDEKMYIVEGDGKTPRKYIKTNKIFTSDGVSGYWEEKEADEIPDQYKFEITVSSSKESTNGHYTAYRMDNLVQIMTDFNHADITIVFPKIAKDVKCKASYRDYDKKNVNWKDEVPLFDSPAQGTLTFNDMPRKRIITIYLH
ncbi:MAG: hypothetical protein ACTSSB_13855 [Candidatus Heimdallarchaeota archaeon]